MTLDIQGRYVIYLSNDEGHVISPSNQFSINARTYEQYGSVQKKVAERLMRKLKDQPKTMLDIGAGTGLVFKSLNWTVDRFIATDKSELMLRAHPAGPNVECIVSDFNEKNWLQDIPELNFDRVISSSSLQWAQNTHTVLSDIKKLGSPVSFSIFTSGTFSLLHKTANIPPLLKSKEEALNIISKLFKNVETELVHYKLNFENTNDIFKYIKRSGVSGARNILGFRQIKDLIRHYPANWLEFEVLFVHEH